MARLKPLAVLMTVGVAARVAAALVMGNVVISLPGIEDQISYHTLALRVLHGFGFTFGQAWWPNTPAGQPTAHWSYLYTLILAGLHALSGEQPLVARLVQAVAAGLLTPWLVYRLAQRVLPSEAGTPPALTGPLAAAAWTAVYGYLVYYAAALMTEAFYILGLLWVFDSSLRLLARAAGRSPAHSLWPWAELGLAIALTAMLRQVFLPFVVLLVPGLVWWHAVRQPQRQRLASLAYAGRGALLAALITLALILPITAYNYQRFQQPVLLNSNAGFAFFWANHPIYGDRFPGILPADGPTYASLIPNELRQLNEARLDSALLRRGLGFVVDDPGRYLRLSLSRLPVYFMFWPSAASQPLSNLVRVASFGVALPFMLLGIALWLVAALQGRLPPPAMAGGTMLLGFAGVYSLIHLLSWSLIRYRLPVDAVLLIFAGQAVAALWRRVRPARAALATAPVLA